MKTAKFIRDIEGWKSNAKLFKVTPKIEWDNLSGSKPKTEYVIVSAISFAFDTGQPETFIFPSDKEGNPLNMLELDGSSRGTTSHEEVLNNAGYKIEKINADRP